MVWFAVLNWPGKRLMSTLSEETDIDSEEMAKTDPFAKNRLEIASKTNNSTPLNNPFKGLPPHSRILLL